MQTELQFKEAEINDMKAKLHSSDKKTTASLLPWHRSVTMVTIIPGPDALPWTLRKPVSAAQSRRRDRAVIRKEKEIALFLNAAVNVNNMYAKSL